MSIIAVLVFLAGLAYGQIWNTNKPVQVTAPVVYVSSQWGGAFFGGNGGQYVAGQQSYLPSPPQPCYSPPYNNINTNIAPYTPAGAYTYGLTQVQLNALIANPAVPKPPSHIIAYSQQWYAWYAQYAQYSSSMGIDGIPDPIQGDPGNLSGAVNRAAFDRCMSCTSCGSGGAL